MLAKEQIVSGEKQLKEFTKFIQNHDALLNSLIYKSVVVTDSDSDGDKNKRNFRPVSQLIIPPMSSKTKEIPTQRQNIIGLDFNPLTEAISTIELITSDNKCLNKMIAVFVQLCMEVRQLSKEGHTILSNCLFADEDLCIMQNMHELTDSNEKDMKINSGDALDSEYDDSPLTVDIIHKISNFLDLLCQAEHFVERIYVVISEIIKQFSALFAAENNYYINVSSSSLHFQTVFNYLAEATIQIVKFDNVLKNGQLQCIWSHYMKAINLAEQIINKSNGKITGANNAKRYNLDDITGLKNVLQKIEYLFYGDLFQNLIDSTFQIKGQIAPQALTLFSAQFHCFLKNTLNDLQKYTTNQNASNNAANANILATAVAAGTPDTAMSEALLTIMNDIIIEPSKLLLKLNTMSILYHHLFGNLDQKLLSSIVECNTKLVCISLIENLLWSPETFLNRYGNTLLMKIRGGTEKMSSNNMQRIQKQWLQTKCQRLTKDTQTYCVQIALWILKMRNQFENRDEKLTQKALLILQGIELIERLGSTISFVTNLHVHLKCPMTKQSILSICKLIEFLKIIKQIFHEYSSAIFYTSQSLVQYQIHQALLIISSVKRKLLGDNASSTTVYNEQIIDILSAMELSETALAGSPSIKRMLVARLALSMADPIRQFQTEQLNKICRLFVAIEHSIQIKETIETLATSSFMYWHYEAIFPIYLRNALEQNSGNDCERVLYLFDSAIDCHNDLMSRNLVNYNCSIRFMEEISTILYRLIISKVCGYIETKLRLDVHTNLQLLEINEMDPFTMESTVASTEIPIYDLCRILQLKPISVVNSNLPDSINTGPVDRYLNVRDHVGIYLSQMFYNLTTISMHDWRTYGQMRNVAEQKFYLETVEDHLPTQTLEQGLDVLEIMRNIHLFVSKYLYNLNNQIFIERSSNNKHLNTINIRHIANSLRTHGIGIINTTVNFTYQFLHKKFYIFSQFLYNEHVQSRLMKDLKSFRESNMEKPEENQMYNYEKASSFNKGIRKLGLSESGQSSLDMFRQLITQIGNAMGYVRMMRSGGIHCCSNASIFLPVVDANLNIQKLCEVNKLSEVTVNAAKNLECDINHLRRNYAEGTEYFRLLVDAFLPFFRSEKNSYLKLFYLIVPPLILNYVEYIITAKEKMNKKTKQDGTFFTDDGFAMGLAFILKLLNQKSEFSSLHWFKAVRQKYARERDQLLANREGNSNLDVSNNNNQNYDAKLQQTLALSEKRFTIILQEYDLLYCNLSSANIFFQ